jgi:adenine-specific DNA-methyltransferase
MSDKLDMHSPNLVDINLEIIVKYFPNCVTETNNGLAVDFDLLKQELNTEIVEGTKERYRLEWPGKKEAIVTANLPTTKTLRPVRKDSEDFDTTENLYIEGDNLEVLKLLQESYLGKIKMIYIDPPYNTGKDFVYKDNFTQNADEFKEESGLVDELNNRLVVNPETSGRYHSDWLSMMYPRLKLARNLLTDDGVIFISIDDNEIDNLLKISSELFGEIAIKTIAVKMSESSGLKMNSVKKNGTIPKLKEYIVIIKKDGIKDLFIKPISKGHWDSEYNIFIEGLAKEDRSLISEIQEKEEDVSENDIEILDKLVSKFQIKSVSEKLKEENVTAENKEKWLFDNAWRICQSTTSASVLTLANEKRKKNNNSLFFVKSATGLIYLVKSGYDTVSKKPRLQLLFADDYLEQNPGDFWSHIKTTGLDNEGGVPYKNGKKPLKLLQSLIESKKDMDKEIVLDFFSGSSSTAEAVLRLNSVDKLNRKFIMVQLPEDLDVSLKEATSKESKKSIKESIEFLDKRNLPHYLTELGKERIRISSKKIKEETNAEIDYGFRVYRLDESNMQDVYYKPQDFNQGQLDVFADNVKPGRTADDLLAQVMLDWGLPLSLKIEQFEIDKKQVFKVAQNSLLACFDSDIDEDFAKEVAIHKPLRIVFKDSSFKDDTAKENVKQLLKQLSPETEMKVL